MAVDTGQVKEEERPDPLRAVAQAVVGVPAEPQDPAEVDKATAGEASTGAPPAGRNMAQDALAQGPKGFLQILGPGLVTGASDDDPSGIGTYSQAGSQFGLHTLWMALFTLPLMIAVQEACARIALHTGVGLATVLRRKFPAWLVGVCVLAMVGANIINVGADLGAIAAGGELISGSRVRAAWLVVPVAVLLIVMQFRLPYATIFRIFKVLTLTLFAYIITLFVVRPGFFETFKATVIPHVELNKDFLGIMVAVLGTTISPYLFFWQASSEVEEMKAAGATTEEERRGVSRKELRAARVDVVVGMGFSQAVMYAIILTSATVLNAHGHTDIQTAQQAADALRPLAGPFAFVLFSLGLIGTGLLAIPVLTGSAAYAVKEFFGFKGSLADRPIYRPTFYGIIALAIVGGLLMNFIGINPIQALVVTAVINGLVAPPILALIALAARDRKVMGQQRSGHLSNTMVWIATLLMAAAGVALVATFFIH